MDELNEKSSGRSFIGSKMNNTSYLDLSQNTLEHLKFSLHSTQCQSILLSKLSPLRKNNRNVLNINKNSTNLEAWIRLKEKFSIQNSLVGAYQSNILETKDNCKKLNNHSAYTQGNLKTTVTIFNNQSTVLSLKNKDFILQKKSKTKHNANISQFTKKEQQSVILKPIITVKEKSPRINQKLAIIKASNNKNNKMNVSLHAKFKINQSIFKPSISKGQQSNSKQPQNLAILDQSIAQPSVIRSKKSHRATHSFYSSLNNISGSNSKDQKCRIQNRVSDSHAPYYDTEKGQQSTRKKIIKNILLNPVGMKQESLNRECQSKAISVSSNRLQAHNLSEIFDKLRFKKPIMFDMGKMKSRGINRENIKKAQDEINVSQRFLRQITLMNPLNRLELDNLFYSFVKSYNLNEEKCKAFFQESDHT